MRYGTEKLTLREKKLLAAALQLNIAGDYATRGDHAAASREHHQAMKVIQPILLALAEGRLAH